MTNGRMCPVCRRSVDQFEPGPRNRPDARCGGCQSLERHRFLALLLHAHAPTITSAGLLVDIAPSRQTSGLFHKPLRPKRYVRMDFDPGADGRDVDVQASLTDLPFRSGAADVVICYHVLEHIPDDATAMKELHRVLAPGGMAFVQVPFHPGRATDEDPSAPTEERIRRFGQADHVRAYGDDFETRLRAAGLEIVRITPREIAGSAGVELYRLQPEEATWLVWPAGADRPAFDAKSLRRTIRDQVRADSRPTPAPSVPTQSRRPRPMSARLRWAATHPLEATRRVTRRISGGR
ncbi:methyltransferase domain-containing protein [Solwaraspora sp. WMMD406]|uniref:class I SAM-dependent methyltransferase n=1 Tax=Solwaraspora sp. WMMD406 TaxID=3016095 RepID=UPI002415FAE4|nr:class I SAM-dependent methyltransferase [Solwaraspora sp. WMMD406]MDG4768284.1 methyltransferase domain-containing protein [Solwaraspora sp. WMMD406]